METKTAVRAAYLTRLLINLAVAGGIIGFLYWVVAGWQVRNIFVLGIMFVLLLPPALALLSKIPVNLAALRAIWRSEDPESLHQVFRSLETKETPPKP
jgi:hypothetical protein